MNHEDVVAGQSMQTKLAISTPGDPSELEADRAADEVMRMPDSGRGDIGITESRNPSLLHRQCAECARDEARGDLSQMVRRAVGEGGGRLEPGTQTLMESRFGQSFDHVRVHTGSTAGESARAINALAYTVGTDIVFAPGMYAPKTSSGRKLLAHELAHTIQQGGTRGLVKSKTNSSVIQRQPAPPSGGGVTPAQTMPRPEEIALSFSSPGKIAFGTSPTLISLYNFAINEPALKPEHQMALAQLGLILKSIHKAKISVVAKGHADNTGEESINDPLSFARVTSVAAELKHQSGRFVDPSWYGARQPVADNTTVDGRSRNRRVDLYLSIELEDIKDVEKKKKKKPHNGGNGDGGGGDGDGDGNGDGDGWSLPNPCAGLLGLLFCGAIACAFAPEICLFCMSNPEICLAPLLPKKPGKPNEPPKPKKRIACPDVFKITDPVRVDPYSTAILIEPFTMRVHFKQDDLWADPDKDPCCDCNCGEYRQYVRGYFYHPTAPGLPPRMQPHVLADGKLLDVNDLREDGPDPYGHRYRDAARTVLRPNQSVDEFLDDHGADDPRNGCLYLGTDTPGVFPSALDEEVRIHLEFWAMPWDACNDHSVGSWRSWIINIVRDPNAKVI